MRSLEALTANPESAPIHAYPLSIMKYTGEILGYGTASAVHLYKINDYPVAVKAFHNDLNYNDELNIHKNLKHPHIIRLIGTVFHGQNKCRAIILEQATRGALSDYLRDVKGERRTEQRVSSYVNGFAEGLYYLHSKRVIHCDLKPDNLLITEDSSLKISDFSNSLQLFKEDYLDYPDPLGAWQYRSPELNLKNLRYCRAADIYAFALIVSHLIEHYHSGYTTHSSPAEKSSIINAINEIASDSLVNLVDSCLHEDPAKRPTAEKVLDTIKQPGIKFKSK